MSPDDKPPASFARMSISLPSDLKARMEASCEQVNWSIIAARAFEERLAAKQPIAEEQP
jgi:hypothetical protein